MTVSTNARTTDSVRGPGRSDRWSDSKNPRDRHSAPESREGGHNEVKQGEWQRIARSRGRSMKKPSDGVLDGAKKRAREKYATVREALQEEKKRLASLSGRQRST